MIRTHLRLGTFVTFAALSLFACAPEPMNVVQAHEAGRGTAAVYEAPIDQVWTAAHAALHWENVGKPTDHGDEHWVITDPAGIDQVGIWLEAQGDTATRAKIVVMDRPQFPGPDEKMVEKDIAKALALMAEGKPLDKRP